MSKDPTAIELMGKYEGDPFKDRMVGWTNHGSHRIDIPYISHIKDNLYQGGVTYNLVLPSNIKHLVSLYPWERYKVKHDLDSFLEIRMYDSLDQNLDQIRSLGEWVAVRMDEGPVLAHCQAGLNRSSLVAGMALVTRGMSGNEAVELLREKRGPAVLCNQAFEKWLRSQ